MLAAFIRQTGDPSVIEYDELPVPDVGPTQVKVRVEAVAVNPIDTYIRAGSVTMASQFPYIIGCDVAGVVEECGAGVQRFQVGDRVWGSNQGLFGRQGTFAEYAVIEERWLYPTPLAMNSATAAAGALVGLTAHLGLMLHGSLRAGEVVLVNGGAGGVGSAAIQVAKAYGARVIATAGNDQNLAICRQLGADLAVNYRDGNKDDQIRSFSMPHGGVQLWLETQRDPTFDRTMSLLAPRGRLILMAGRNARPEFPVGPFYVKDLRVIGFAMFNATSDEQRASADAIHQMFANGRWQMNIGATFPLSKAAEAHELQEANTLHKQGTLRGKIVLVPDTLYTA